MTTAEISRLSAAAPELLAALKQARVELEEAANLLRPSLPSTSHLFAIAAMRAEDVIAKAEGRAA